MLAQNNSRQITNEPLRWLNANHPELMTPSGAIDASNFATGQDAANYTTRLLTEAGVLPATNRFPRSTESSNR